MLEQVIRAAEIAGDIILRNSHARVYRKEGHGNFVTEADFLVQETLAGLLREILPDSVLFAEEKENEPLTDAWTWVVDPIDGTTNFIRGRSCSAVSIGLLKDKKPYAGVIRNPYLQETFSAEKGKGAFLNGERITVSDTPMDTAIVTYGTALYNESLADITMEKACVFLKTAGDLRRTGSAALDFCDVACGRSDVFFEYQLSPWDYAAGTIIVTEAGGHCEQFRNKTPDFGQKAAIMASNEVCYKQVMKILNA